MRVNHGMRSVLSLLLALVLAFGLLPAAAFAADDYYDYYDDAHFYNWYNYYRYSYDSYYDYYSDTYYRDSDDRYYNYYGGYYQMYDEDLYRRWSVLLPENDLEVRGGKEQVYTGEGSISFVIPKKGVSALSDVKVYPTGKRSKEQTLERKVDYTAKSGLTITLKGSYLDTLKNGEYQVVMRFGSVQAYASFTVKR